uniref:Uncharacterized protein n=1 Tax=Toxoplasma gondii COUG TaxID=1074873 RepID=A0A2G8Y1I7_TOXGO|nr:hypothetical protein TGCOUG_393250 [Toxoplasma gondii COUG]
MNAVPPRINTRSAGRDPEGTRESLSPLCAIPRMQASSLVDALHSQDRTRQQQGRREETEQEGERQEAADDAGQEEEAGEEEREKRKMRRRGKKEQRENWRGALWHVGTLP